MIQLQNKPLQLLYPDPDSDWDFDNAVCTCSSVRGHAVMQYSVASGSSDRVLEHIIIEEQKG